MEGSKSCPFGANIWETYVDLNWDLLSESTQELYQQVINLFIQTFKDDSTLFKVICILIDIPLLYINYLTIF